MKMKTKGAASTQFRRDAAVSSFGHREFRRDREGSALFAVVPITLLLASLGAALLLGSVNDSRESGQSVRNFQANLVAEAVALRAIGSIEASIAQSQATPTQLGSPDQPLESHGGKGWASITELSAGVYSIEVEAESGLTERRLEVVVDSPFASIYDYSCLLYTSPSPRDRTRSRMPSSA